MTLRPSDALVSGPPVTNEVGWEWLVSVRTVKEAETAARFNVDVIDLKEPFDGALSPVSPELLHSIAEHPGLMETPLSAALGDGTIAQTMARSVPAAFRFSKAGPAGIDSSDVLLGFWDSIRRRLPDSVELVAVAYADHERARCLPVSSIVELAVEAGFRRILIDTFAKTGESSLRALGRTMLGRTKLATVAEQVRRCGLRWSLAGSITLEEVSQHWPDWTVHHTAPDCLAVRGDVCRGGRRGELCSERMRTWQRFHQAFRPSRVR